MSITTQVEQDVVERLRQAYPNHTIEAIGEMAWNRLWAEISGHLEAPPPEDQPRD